MIILILYPVETLGKYLMVLIGCGCPMRVHDTFMIELQFLYFLNIWFTFLERASHVTGIYGPSYYTFSQRQPVLLRVRYSYMYAPTFHAKKLECEREIEANLQSS